MSEPLMKIISAQPVDTVQGRSVCLAESKTNFIISGSGNVQYYDFDNVSGDFSERVAYQSRYYTGDAAT